MRAGKNARGRAYRAFGGAVRELRARRGLRQETLGFESGLHRNYVGAVERGEINPTLRVVFKLARGLTVAPSELLVLAEHHHGALDGCPRRVGHLRSPLRFVLRYVLRYDLRLERRSHDERNPPQTGTFCVLEQSPTRWGKQENLSRPGREDTGPCDPSGTNTPSLLLSNLSSFLVSH